AKSRSEVLFLNEARSLGAEILVSTEDGTLGYRGLVTDLLSRVNLEDYDTLLVCGPEGMMKRVYDYVKSRGLRIYTQFSLERYIKCGIGICGSCALNGLRVCCDGPVFTMSDLEGTDFGQYTRDESGRRVPI
ncbi:MAG TPA: dihydroorotate dehydrogenase electron transfer subunit, partial [Desulfurococcales archaeon]|nr:dihydroorotate dehydrogenase electron transfer subunit [Desulfurococcales archaeon]